MVEWAARRGEAWCGEMMGVGGEAWTLFWVDVRRVMDGLGGERGTREERRLGFSPCLAAHGFMRMANAGVWTAEAGREALGGWRLTPFCISMFLES